GRVPALWPLVIAFAVSGVLSYFLLNRQRIAFAKKVEERAARAAPKIQLVVALVLVPSVLLMIAAGLIANAGSLLSGF
ncbi:MAG: DUF4229 domain-containing protein, partial [Solirubrobacterales bacterium]